jgi:hypothetical protein
MGGRTRRHEEASSAGWNKDGGGSIPKRRRESVTKLGLAVVLICVGLSMSFNRSFVNGITRYQNQFNLNMTVYIEEWKM